MAKKILILFLLSLTTICQASDFAISIKAIIPIGTVSAYAVPNCPTGWLLADGSEISRSTYEDLFNLMGSANGSGNGSTTFNLPDYRGKFLRGVDGAAGNDPDKNSRTAAKTGANVGNAVGSIQGDELKSHNHYYYNQLAGARAVYTNGAVGSGQVDAQGAYTSSVGGNESRPKNVNVIYCVKY